MKNKLIIICASGHGKVVAEIAIKMNKWQTIVFLDDDESIKMSLGLKDIGKTANAFTYNNENDFFIAIGNNTTREMVQEKFEEARLNIVNIIHPSVVFGTDVVIGIATAIMAGVVINSSSTIGKGCIINTSSSLDHDNVVDDFVHISPGVRTAGSVAIGKGTWLGIGSIVSNNVNICSGYKVVAGAVVVKDISEPGTYVGVPVRRMDR